MTVLRFSTCSLMLCRKLELILKEFTKIRGPEEKITALVHRLASKLFNQETPLSFGNLIDLGVT
jgi:hypothetical protein